MPVADAARRVLAARLHVVQHYLRLAVTSPDDDIEYVHHLRVGTRRARAALEIFSPCLPKKKAKAVGKHLRLIREAAGAARDWDVFQQSLVEWSKKRPVDEQPGLDFLRGFAYERRQAAQAALNDRASPVPGSHGVIDFARKPKSRHAPRRLLDLAVVLLLERILALNEALDLAEDDYEHLHRIRILGKRLRYAIEVFADCFPAPFRAELYPAIEEMQEILGEANDSHVGQQRLTELRDRLKKTRANDWPRLNPGIERLLQSYRRRLPQARQKFVHWRGRWNAQSLPLAELLLHVRLSPAPDQSPETPCPILSPVPSNGSAVRTASSD
jgi:CHAD domain-containing protein